MSIGKFMVDSTFDTHDEFLAALEEYKNEYNCNLFVRSSKTFKAMKIVDNYNPDLKFYEIHYVCKYGGEYKSKSKTDGNAKKHRRSMKQGCLMQIKLRALDKQKLYVITFIHEHNSHDINNSITSDVKEQMVVPVQTDNVMYESHDMQNDEIDMILSDIKSILVQNAEDKYEYRKQVLMSILKEWERDSEVVVASIPNNPYINNLAIHREYHEIQTEDNSTLNNFTETECSNVGKRRRKSLSMTNVKTGETTENLDEVYIKTEECNFVGD